MSEHTEGARFVFKFGAPEELFDREVYWDGALNLPYYRVYGYLKGSRYFFKDSKGNEYMVLRKKATIPIVSCKMCGKEASKKCGKCGDAAYCHEKCQKKDWQRHQTECSKHQ